MSNLHWVTDAARADDEILRPNAHVVGFSDSIVRVADPRSPGCLFHEVLALVHAQMEIAAHGVFLRGGLTYGNVYANGTTVFGPAFVEAYELESNFAVVPRVVVGPAALNALNGGLLATPSQHDPDEEAGAVRALLSKGDDGVWFVDYLRAAHGEMDEPDDYCKYTATGSC